MPRSSRCELRKVTEPIVIPRGQTRYWMEHRIRWGSIFFSRERALLKVVLYAYAYPRTLQNSKIQS